MKTAELVAFKKVRHPGAKIDRLATPLLCLTGLFGFLEQKMTIVNFLIGEINFATLLIIIKV